MYTKSPLLQITRLFINKTNPVMMERINWHVVYTKPNCERKIAQQVTQRGIEAYCPQQGLPKEEQQVRVIQGLLFPRWVFVYCTPEQLSCLRRINGIINVLYWQNKPAVITNEDIATLQFVLSRFEVVRTQNTGMIPLEVIQPTLDTKASFVLPSLGFTLFAQGEIRTSNTYLNALPLGDCSERPQFYCLSLLCNR